MEKRITFKGWTVPGPVPPGAERGILPQAGESLDSLSGNFKIFQLKDGHRFSTDDLLTAWYGSSFAARAERVLDLGSGIGSVGMMAAWRLAQANFVTIEAQEISVTLARRSAEYNGLSTRYEIRQGDFRDPSVIGPDEKFDLVLGSPPYFPIDSGALSDHPQKIACRFETRGDISDYCKTAASHLRPAGVFACIFPISPAHQKERVLAAARESGLTILRQRPVRLKETDSPLLGLFLMMTREDLPEASRSQTFVEPDLIIRTQDGLIHPEYSLVKMSVGFPP